MALCDLTARRVQPVRALLGSLRREEHRTMVLVHWPQGTVLAAWRSWWVAHVVRQDGIYIRGKVTYLWAYQITMTMHIVPDET